MTKRPMNKAAEKILNNALVILVILNLVSYQLVLPAYVSRADDTTTDSSSGSSVSASSDPEKESSDDDKDKAEDSDKDADKTSDASDQSDDKASASDEEDSSTADKSDDGATTQDDTTVTDKSSTISSDTADDPADDSGTDVTADDGIADDSGVVTDAAGTTDGTDITTDDPTDNNTGNDVDEGASSAVASVTAENKADDPSSDQPDSPQADTATTVDSDASTEGNSVSDNTLAAMSLLQPQIAPDEQDPTDKKDEDKDSQPEKDQLEEKTVADTVGSGCGQDNGCQTATIDTGDSGSAVAVLNSTNTNVYTDNGQQYVQNIVGDYTGDINLIGTFQDMLDGAQQLNAQNQEAFETVTNINVASQVDNTVTATASTGNNVISGTDGTATIVTGDAAASVAATSFLNTNIVGDNWLLAIINNAGNWTGNLIVPGQGLFNLPSAGIVFDKITNINIADSVSNFLSANANSGNNSITDTGGSATIATGSANSSVSGTNLINTDIVANNWFMLMINNAGSWTGRIFNWNNGRSDLAYTYDFGSLDGTGDDQAAKHVSVNNINVADEVENNISVDADTGNNAISGTTGSATITTGNATATASAVNFINTNIVGNNWFFGVVNNAGTWNGDLVFGYPDLTVELEADKDSLQPGQALNYIVKYKNVGYARCDNVDLMLSLPPSFFYQSDSLGGAHRNGNDLYWTMSGLEPGEEKSFTVNVMLDPKTASDVTGLESVAGVRTDTDEVELGNNYSSDDISVVFPAGSQVVIQDGLPDSHAGLTVKRSEEKEMHLGAVAEHSITVKNSGKDTLYNLQVKERITGPDGKTLVEYVWPIAKLKKGQTAYITYQIVLGAPLGLGKYHFNASASAVDYYGREVKGKKVSRTVTLLPAIAPASVSEAQNESDGAIASEATIAPDDNTAVPEVLGAASVERKIAWQWLLLLLVIPVVHYIRKEKVYRWENIRRWSAQMGSFLSSFFW